MNYQREERKLGAHILATVAEIQRTPSDNKKRFTILRKRLEKAVRRYQLLTGKNHLDPEVDYGYEIG